MNRHILLSSLLLFSFFSLAQFSMQAQESWPGTSTNMGVGWIGYLYANTTPVQDPTNDIGKNVEKWDLTFVEPGARYTVQAAASSSTAFFRLQVTSLTALDGPGTYYVFIANASNTQIGMVYLTIAGNNTWDLIVRNSSSVEAIVASNVAGYTRVVQTGYAGTAFVDFQVPLTTLYNTLGINANTVIKFYSGTSSGTGNIGNVNLDFMTPGNTIDFSTLATVTVSALNIGLLPVELSSFTAHTKSGTTLLKWNTTTEVNNYGFEVQRSFRKDEWEAIAFVHGHGTTNSPRSYSYEDRLPSHAAAEIRYRLRQIDRDGSEEYSPVVMVRGIAQTTFGIADAFPNPFNPSTTLSLNLDVESPVTVKLHDVTGREVMTLLENTILSEGSHSVLIQAPSLPSGRYLAVMTAGSQHSIYPIVLSK
ncbi:MAG: T9SS type A sorting domain-containing protein [Bacteroidia bacterium]|nr:T9SS type A sorting domain-containing protein [Bacteroidia bacterium]